MDLEELTDGEIIERVRAGEVGLFSQLVVKYQRPLVALAISRLGKRDLAEDAVQEAFLCAFRWLDSYNSAFAFRTWLWTILLNQCNRMAEKERKLELLRSRLDHESATSGGTGQTPAFESLEQAESQVTLRRALSILPEAHADAVRLRFFGELKFEAIAQALGCSLRTAKYRVKEGLVRLGEIMGANSRELDAPERGGRKPKEHEVHHALR